MQGLQGDGYIAGSRGATDCASPAGQRATVVRFEKGIVMINRKPTTATVETEVSSRSNGVSRASSPVTSRQVTHEQIARRACEISKSANAGTPEDNWYRAERELRARA